MSNRGKKNRRTFLNAPHCSAEPILEELHDTLHHIEDHLYESDDPAKFATFIQEDFFDAHHPHSIIATIILLPATDRQKVSDLIQESISRILQQVCGPEVLAGYVRKEKGKIVQFTERKIDPTKHTTPDA